MKHKLAWVAALLAVAVLASGAWRAQSTRQARQHTLQEQAQRSPAPLMLQKSELLALVNQWLQMVLYLKAFVYKRSQLLFLMLCGGRLCRHRQVIQDGAIGPVVAVAALHQRLQGALHGQHVGDALV